MHMSDALVSVAVGTAMAAVSTGVIGYSIKKIKKNDLEDNKIPMMGVMGAFVFAAQMINFTIPVTGSSGHIGGGILLAALLGPFPAFITLASVLIIQALFFADGGLLALGCNIFNMGFFSCLIAYPLIYKPILKKSITPRRITIASIIASVVGLQLGALAVVLQTTASGMTKLPFASFLALMQPIHLAIGIIEGMITGAVLCFIYHVRKDIIINSLENEIKVKIPMKKVLTYAILATIFVGGFVSLYASTKPDGLEWSLQRVLGTTDTTNSSEAHTAAQELQDKTAILPDYSFENELQENKMGTSVSGLVGGLLTLTVITLSGLAIMSYKKQKQKRKAPLL
ncbi:MAG: energy-coupling factor ABC transporter permease [Mobilitalea sp.]